MKKIRDFIYDFSDIFTAILVLALAGSIIFWRVQVIMGYSDMKAASEPKTEIDIDFSDVDLDPIEKPGFEDDETDITEETDEVEEPQVVVIDENYKSTKQVAVAIPAGAGYSEAIRYVASAYGFSDDDYFTFYNLLWNKGIAMGADYRIQIGTFTIPAGSSLEDMIKIIAAM
ncbi:MAG: hypothetical protein J5528_06695 [Firmicutes bacterium]|nr:hypothetical protein [Bacillota bacterium]